MEINKVINKKTQARLKEKLSETPEEWYSTGVSENINELTGKVSVEHLLRCNGCPLCEGE